MAIQYNQIPVNLRVPGQYIEFSNENMNSGLSGYPTKMLLIGQKIASGSAEAMVPKLITSTAQAKALFGRGSQLAHMCEVAVGANSFIEKWAIPVVDDVAGVKATGSISVSGTATASGTLVLYIGGRYQIKTKVTAGMTAAQVATALVAALADEPDLALTAAIDGEVASKVNLTARNAGEAANTISLRLNYYTGEETPAGVALAIVQMAGGTGNPDIDDVFAAIGDAWFTDIVTPWTDGANTAALETELAKRSDALKMIEAYAYIARAQTLSNLVLTGQSRNSEFVVPVGVNGGLEPSYEWASIMGTVCAYESNQDPARPLQTVALTGLKAPAIADRFSLEEQNILLWNGHSTFDVDAGGIVRLQRVITSYRKNSYGFDDASFLNLETMKTMAYLRYDVRSLVAQRYPRHKLADDGTAYGRGQYVVTPDVMRNTLIGRFDLWENAGLVEDKAQFKRDLIVERDGNDPDRLNSYIPPNCINQFRIFAGKLAPLT